MQSPPGLFPPALSPLYLAETTVPFTSVLDCHNLCPTGSLAPAPGKTGGRGKETIFPDSREEGTFEWALQIQ